MLQVCRWVFTAKHRALSKCFKCAGEFSLLNTEHYYVKWNISFCCCRRLSFCYKKNSSCCRRIWKAETEPSSVSAGAEGQFLKSQKLSGLLYIAKSSRFQVPKVPLTHLTEDRSGSSLLGETVGGDSNPPQLALVRRFWVPSSRI